MYMVLCGSANENEPAKVASWTCEYMGWCDKTAMRVFARHAECLDSTLVICIDLGSDRDSSVAAFRSLLSPLGGKCELVANACGDTLRAFVRQCLEDHYAGLEEAHYACNE